MAKHFLKSAITPIHVEKSKGLKTVNVISTVQEPDASKQVLIVGDTPETGYDELFLMNKTSHLALFEHGKDVGTISKSDKTTLFGEKPCVRQELELVGDRGKAMKTFVDEDMIEGVSIGFYYFDSDVENDGSYGVGYEYLTKTLPEETSLVLRGQVANAKVEKSAAALNGRISSCKSVLNKGEFLALFPEDEQLHALSMAYQADVNALWAAIEGLDAKRDKNFEQLREIWRKQDAIGALDMLLSGNVSPELIEQFKEVLEIGKRIDIAKSESSMKLISCQNVADAFTVAFKSALAVSERKSTFKTRVSPEQVESAFKTIKL